MENHVPLLNALMIHVVPADVVQKTKSEYKTLEDHDS